METLERAVIEALASSEGAVGQILLEQHARASVLRRDWSGVGVNTYFSVPADAPRVETTENPIGRPILIDLEGLKEGASAVMWIEAGALDSLEIFTFDEPWPEHPVITGISG